MPRLLRSTFLWACLLFGPTHAYATIFGSIRGIVHDPSHRPILGAAVALRESGTQFVIRTKSDDEGAFEFASVPAGQYTLEIEQPGFAKLDQPISVSSGTTALLHFQLQLGTESTTVTVAESPETLTTESITPKTQITQNEIQDAPGASLTNSLNMITNYVPGSYMTHDQLHIRGGHQVTWAIDGVPIPNTNIASNVGPQIDPKDIDTLEVQRGGYSSEYGDRTYGVFDVVPKTGFEQNGELDLFSTYGSFQQTNDQVSFGDHTERLGYYASLSGNRSDYGLETPGPQVDHDRVWGLGGFSSLIFNVDPANQLRFVTSVRRDDYQIPVDPTQIDIFSRDVERERDAMANFSWIHTFSPNMLLTASPFIHFNRANYDSDPNDIPISAIQHLDSTYGGAQVSLNDVTQNHNARIGLYGFAQHDNEYVNLVANDGSGSKAEAEQTTNGYLAAAFLEDQWKLGPWITLTGGLRLTHFSGAISENAADPRVGLGIRIPRLNWVLRGFYGAYYQAPPLSTVTGPLLDYAVSQGLGVIPLKGERDEENQVGITIPVKAWTFDVNNFRIRATNYFDHNALGNSNVFFPISIAGARIYGTEFTMRSPRIWRGMQASIAYSYQHAEGEGAITGGLTDFSPPADGYFLLDHDQRHTLHGNWSATLPYHVFLDLAAYFGSGFTDGSSPVPAHLESHTTVDATLGRSFGENWSLGVTALNLANRRFLLDNSQTFGGTHYADPRQIYFQLRYRLHL